MAFPMGGTWHLDYASMTADARLLVTMPSELRRDLRVLARARGLTLAETVRVAVTREIADVVHADPRQAKSFTGVLRVAQAPKLK